MFKTPSKKAVSYHKTLLLGEEVTKISAKRRKKKRAVVRYFKKAKEAVVGYFRKTWTELRKVSWPTRREALNLTLIVLAVTASMAALLGIIDYLFTLIFRLIIH
jgi:preprotein translocase subunit SecE